MTLPNFIAPEAGNQKSVRVLTPVGGGPLIRLDKAALHYVESFIRSGFKSGSLGATEMCGIVLGQAIDSSSEVSITGFVPVDLKPRFGTVFRASEADINLLRSAVVSAGGNAVGYFRSHLSDEPAIRDEDLHLLSELFPSAASCFFAIHVAHNIPSNVDLYRIRTGAPPELLELFALLEPEPAPPAASATPKPPAEEKPQHPKPAVGMTARNRTLSTLASSLTKAEDSGPAPTVAGETSPASSSDADTDSLVPSGELAPRSHSRLGRIEQHWTWIFGGAAVLILALGAWFVNRRFPPTPPPASPTTSQTVVSKSFDPKIDLHILEQESGSKIFWDPVHPAVAGSTHGLLIITDRSNSSTSEEIELDAAALHSGFYQYDPIKDPVTVQIVVYQPDGSLVGEMKSFTPAESNGSALVAAVPPSTPSASFAYRSERPEATSQHSDPSAPTATGATSPDTALDHPSVAAPSAAPQEQPPAPLAPPTQPVVSSPPPQLTPAPVSRSTPSPDSPVAVTLPASVPATSQPDASFPQAGPTRLLAPRLIRQVVPSVPRGVVSRLRSEVIIDVAVSVDVDGKATGAQVVSSQGASAGLLAIEALKAAQFCRFLPAQQDGKPVQGRIIVTFRFAPKRD